jgi:hypothetical protein
MITPAESPSVSPQIPVPADHVAYLPDPADEPSC